jgi:hypothetical protein
MTREQVLNEFDVLIECVGDPDSREAWSEHDTVMSLRELRAKVDAALLDALRVCKSSERIDPKPGERWG